MDSMKVILAAVCSFDGKITKWQGNLASDFASTEDQELFSQIKLQNNLLIMGSNTYDAVFPKPEKERLRIVLTSNPKKYQKFEIPGQLEFIKLPLNDAISSLEKRGYKQALLVGGGKLTTSFLRENLVSEIWLTLEPVIFGLGKVLIDLEKLDIKLQLLEFKKLNSQGTLFLKYAILNK